MGVGFEFPFNPIIHLVIPLAVVGLVFGVLFVGLFSSLIRLLRQRLDR